MNTFAALRGLRVGCVQYLNAKPLIVPYEGEVVFDHPGRLSDLLAAGEIDVALIPVFEALRQPAFPIVDGVAIASQGEVYSVFLAYRGPLEKVKHIQLDAASRTSSHLVRCLLSEFHGLNPAYECCGNRETSPEEGRGIVLIGNQAIRFREAQRPGVAYLDLGADWTAQTQLPFVYAVWQIRPEVRNADAVARALRTVKERGLRRVAEIAREQRDFAPDFAERYLTEYIRFDFGEEEKTGLALFRELLQKRGLIDAPAHALRFV